MKTTIEKNEALPEGHAGAAIENSGPVMKAIKKFFTKFRHKHTSLNFHCQQGGCIKVYYVINTKEEIQNLILDNHGPFNIK